MFQHHSVCREKIIKHFSIFLTMTDGSVKCDKCGKDASLINTNDDKEAWVCHECEHFISYKCEVYSRVVGYMRPVSQWNKGKQQEFKDRTLFKK
jgi:anaerobic ribonucleoside-triphosphate reductase